MADATPDYGDTSTPDYSPRRPKPKGYYNRDVKNFIDEVPNLVRGSRGYPIAATPPIFDAQNGGAQVTAAEQMALWALMGSLKRAWEYPLLLDYFAVDPWGYLLSNRQLVVADAEGIFTTLLGLPAPLVMPLAAVSDLVAFATADLNIPVGRGVGLRVAVTGPGDAPDVVLYLIHRLHVRYADPNAECK